MTSNFLFQPHKPVILKKIFYKNNQSEEKLFLFYATEEKGGKDLKEYHKYTIYFCELTAKNQNMLIRSDTARVPFEPYNHYAILIRGQKEASVQSWDKTIATKYPQKETSKDINHHKLDFIINPRSCGLGSLILNHLIYWGQTLYPKAEIVSLSLSPHDERNEDNKERRDKLYSNIGLINYSGVKPLLKLTPILSSRGVEVINLHEYLNGILLNEKHLEQNVKRMEHQVNKHSNEISSIHRNLSLYKFQRNLIIAVALVLLGLIFYS